MARIHTFVASVLLAITTSPQAADGQVKWVTPFPGNIGSSVSFDQQNNRLFVGSADNSVYSLDSLGNTLWRFETGGYIAGNPVVSEDGETLYVTSYDHHLYALNSENGNLLWAFDAGAKIYGSPAIDQQGQVYFGAENGYFFAVSPDTGLERWHFNAGSNIGSTPAISHDGKIYFGTENGKLYSLSISEFDSNPNATHAWVISNIQGLGVASPIVGLDGTVYVGSSDSTLYSIDSSGSITWTTDLGARITSSPVIDRAGILYLSTFDNGSLNAVDSTDGELLWVLPLSEVGTQMYSAPAIGHDQVVYVSDFDGYVFAIDRTLYDPSDLSAMFKWAIDLNSPLVASPLISSDGTLYIPAQNHSLYALDVSSLGQLDSPWPMSGNNAFRASRQTQVDSDSDGLPDAWEVDNGVSTATADNDSDNLTSYQEYLAFTDPNNADSDSDGMPDGWEVSHGSNPIIDDAGLDADNDGMTNLAEYEYELANPPEVPITGLVAKTTQLLGGQITTTDDIVYELSHINGTTLSWPSYEIRDLLPDIQPGEKVTISAMARTEPNSTNNELALDLYSMYGGFIDSVGVTDSVAQSSSLSEYSWQYKNLSGEKITAPILRFRFPSSTESTLKAYVSNLTYQIKVEGMDYADLVAEVSPNSAAIVEPEVNEHNYKLSHNNSSSDVDFLLSSYLPVVNPDEILLVNTTGRTDPNTDDKGTQFAVTGLTEHLIDSRYESDGLDETILQSVTNRLYTRVYRNSAASPAQPSLLYSFNAITDPLFTAYVNNVSYKVIPSSGSINWVQDGVFRRDAAQLYDLAQTGFPVGTELWTNTDDAKIALDSDFTFAFWRSEQSEQSGVSTYQLRNFIPTVLAGQTLSVSFTGNTALNSDGADALVEILGDFTNLSPSSNSVLQSDQQSQYTIVYNNDSGVDIASPVLQISFAAVSDPAFKVFMKDINFTIDTPNGNGNGNGGGGNGKGRNK